AHDPSITPAELRRLARSPLLENPIESPKEVKTMMNRAYSTLAAVIVSSVLASAAQALPASPVPPASSDGVVEKVHGCHRSCEWGPVLRWHRHGRFCRPIVCVPRAPWPNRCWVDWLGRRHCRW